METQPTDQARMIRSMTAYETNQKLVVRAMTAYFRSVKAEDSPDQPNTGTSDVMEVEGKRYVVLTGGGDGVVAVYRVRNDGVLKRLTRWPEVLRAMVHG